MCQAVPCESSIPSKAKRPSGSQEVPAVILLPPARHLLYCTRSLPKHLTQRTFGASCCLLIASCSIFSVSTSTRDHGRDTAGWAFEACGPHTLSSSCHKCSGKTPHCKEGRQSFILQVRQAGLRARGGPLSPPCGVYNEILQAPGYPNNTEMPLWQWAVSVMAPAARCLLPANNRCAMCQRANSKIGSCKHRAMRHGADEHAPECHSRPQDLSMGQQPRTPRLVHPCMLHACAHLSAPCMPCKPMPRMRHAPAHAVPR